MFKLDMWMASPSALSIGSEVILTDICCKACTGRNPEGFYSKFCKICKYKENPITVGEILDTRRKY